MCEGANLEMFLDLGMQLHSDGFLTAEELQQPEVFYHLSVFNMADQTPRFQKSKQKKNYDSSSLGFLAQEDIAQKKRIAELEAILDKSTDFLSEDDVKNIKKLLSKLSAKLLDELKQALINKQMNKFREIEVLHEDDSLAA